MWRNLVLLSLAVLAAPLPAGAQPDAPFEAATVKVFLEGCGRDMSQCDFKVRMALLDKLAGKDAVSVCLKGAHYQQPVIDWLKAHPETGAMATEDGIYAAFRSLYPCP